VSSLTLQGEENYMKKRHSEEQIIRILREAEAREVPIRDVCKPMMPNAYSAPNLGCCAE